MARRGGNRGGGRGGGARAPARKSGGGAKKRGVKVGGFSQPPFMSYDPAIEAQRLAARRGLRDTKIDIRRENKQGRRDFRQALRDLSLKASRGYEDLALDAGRGQEKIGFQREDALTRQRRGHEDFATRLSGLTRDFMHLGRSQTQGAQAAGVSEGGTNAAAAQKRTENFALARQPLDTGRQRLDEDTASRLGRLDIAGQQLGEDVGRERGRLGQDIGRDTRLAGIERKVQKRDLKLKKQRAIREQTFADVDLIREEIYQARSSRPGAFSKFGPRNRGGGARRPQPARRPQQRRRR